MDDWQPVRMNSAEAVFELHGGVGIDLETSRLNEGLLLRVRPISEIPPCNATRGFEIHPDDIHKTHDRKRWLCEHQILAD